MLLEGKAPPGLISAAIQNARLVVPSRRPLYHALRAGLNVGEVPDRGTEISRRPRFIGQATAIDVELSKIACPATSHWAPLRGSRHSRFAEPGNPTSVEWDTPRNSRFPLGREEPSLNDRLGATSSWCRKATE